MTELAVTFDDDDFARAFVAVNGATTAGLTGPILAQHRLTLGRRVPD